jgi:nucleoside-diphosphate-sugar epimerase
MMSEKIVITGAAGLLGQNLIPRLKASGFAEIVAIDKHPTNTQILRRLHPDITIVATDLAHDNDWQDSLKDADVLICGHAQIGGIDPQPFQDNNVLATKRLLDAARLAKVGYLIQISTSAVNSKAVDLYTESKREQEAIATAAGMPLVVLRPTLMFGWFDRKHLGWLARFLARTPVFPIPGTGRFTRQPLYAGDFGDIVMACIDKRIAGAYNISGLTKIDYIDLIRTIRRTLDLRTPIVKIPYGLFWLLLKAYALVDRDPPFTTNQLKALVIPEEFEVIDWPSIFGVRGTPLENALAETFLHPQYSKIVLEF